MPISGQIRDVVVDLRKDSKTHLQHLCVELKNDTFLYVPEGFAHGFAVLSPQTYVVYGCTKEYNKSSERGIRFDDSDLKINWEVDAPIVSEKDQHLPSLKEVLENEKKNICCE